MKKIFFFCMFIATTLMGVAQNKAQIATDIRYTMDDFTSDAIAFDMKRGVTMIPSKGWYTKEDRDVLMVVTRKTDLNLLLRYVKQIDSEAFLSVSSVMGVYGQGFDTIKVKPDNKKHSGKS